MQAKYCEAGMGPCGPIRQFQDRARERQSCGESARTTSFFRDGAVGAPRYLQFFHAIAIVMACIPAIRATQAGQPPWLQNHPGREEPTVPPA